MNQEVMKQWLDQVWRRRRGAFFSQKSLLIYDSHKSHLTPEVQAEVKKHSQLAVIPGGLTKKLQPLDLTINRSFKCKMRQKWEDWMLNGIKTFTKTNRIRKAGYEEVCKWVAESWQEITEKCIKNGFKSAELHHYAEDLDEDNDDITIVNPSEPECSDSEEDQVVNQYKDLFETFDIESDEEFDGFD
jgi:hypothetical protein